MTSLDVGCGPNHKTADIGIDRLPGPAVDCVHDLNSIPWPFASNTFDRVDCYNVLEHLADVVSVMCEIHRISKPDARIQVRVPTGSSSDLFTDPTHVRGFGYRSFDYFTGEGPLADFGYTGGLFAVDVRRFERGRSRLGAIDALAARFANRWPAVYESRLCYLYPMSALYFELRAVKP